MKLYAATPSPFVRKVRVAAIELGVMDKIKIVETSVAPGQTDPQYGKSVNPLRKIPALELDNGTVLADSSVICDYLNAIAGGDRLIPAGGDERWNALAGQAVASGLTEAAVSVRYETFLRPEANRWPVWIDEQWEKINNALAWMSERAPKSETTVDAIALACALGYLDFRFPDMAWRTEHPRLERWYENISKRDAYLLTSPEG